MIWIRQQGNVRSFWGGAVPSGHATSIGQTWLSTLVGLHRPHFEVFGVLVVLSTVLGCLMERIGMIVIIVPLLYPALANYGIDPT